MKETNCSAIDAQTDTIPAIVTHAMSYKGLQQHLKKEGRKDIGKGMAIGALGFIPFVGSLPDSVKNICSGYRENQFFRKLLAVLYQLEEVNHAQMQQFLNDIRKTAGDYSGNVLTEMIDRLDNINKGFVLANLIEARAKSEITMEDFFRLASMLERIPFPDLNKLVLFAMEPHYEPSGITELLYASGALIERVLEGGADTKYMLSELGIKMARHGLKLDVRQDGQRGMVVNPGWDIIK